MNKFIILPVILACNLYAGLNNYFLDNDTVTFSAKDDILDSSYGAPVAGKKLLSWQNKSINYLHEENINDTYIFKVINSSIEHAGIMTKRCNLSVIAYKLSNNKYSKIWEINNNNCSGAIDSTRTFFTTTQFGCCGSDDVYTHYSIETGKFIAKSTSHVFLVPNAELMVVYFSNTGCDAYSEPEDKISGIIYLVNKNAILDKAYLIYPPRPTRTPDIIIDSKDYNPKIGQPIILNLNCQCKLYINEHGNKIIIPQNMTKLFSK
jgi:hypothetical protein